MAYAEPQAKPCFPPKDDAPITVFLAEAFSRKEKQRTDKAATLALLDHLLSTILEAKEYTLRINVLHPRPFLNGS